MIYAFIPIRSGSKSIRNKNIKEFNGRPLCYWTIKSCQESKKIDKIIVAVDSNKYSKIVSDFNFDKVELYRRDKLNAKDHSSSESVIMEFLIKSSIPKSSTFILIQATSPHLSSAELSDMIDMSIDKNCDIVSCVRLKRFIWNEKGEPINYNIYKRPRRQDFSGILIENGAVYISKVDKILKTNNRISGSIKTYEMNEDSFIEIDEKKDFLISEFLMQESKTNKK